MEIPQVIKDNGMSCSVTISPENIKLHCPDVESLRKFIDSRAEQVRAALNGTLERIIEAEGD